MKSKIIAFTAAFSMILGLSIQASSVDASLNLKDGASESFIITSAAILGGLGAVATAVLGSAAGAIASGVINKILSKGEEPAVAKKVIDKMIEESINEAEAAAANGLGTDLNLDGFAAQKMTEDDLTKKMAERGFSPEKAKRVLEKARERFIQKAKLLEKELDKNP